MLLAASIWSIVGFIAAIVVVAVLLHRLLGPPPPTSDREYQRSWRGDDIPPGSMGGGF